MDKEKIKTMTEEEIKRRLEWSDPYEFGTVYAEYLLEENQQLKDKLEASEKARKEANKIILECLLSEEYNTLNSNYLSIVFFKLTKVLNLDIDKGE